MKVLNRSAADVPAAPPEKIIQFGGGNFLRAFADWIVDVMNEEQNFQAGVLVVKPTPGGSYRDLDDQGGLFHVCLRGRQGGALVDQCRLITCISRTIHPYERFAGYLASAEQPGIELIVSNTTEAGILYREADRYADRPALSFPGKLTQWLYHRYRHFEASPAAGCTILPTELIEENGATLRQYVLQYARQWQLDKGFSAWLKAHNDFCNTLVDRIVTGHPSDPAIFNHRLGFRDRLLIAAEPYLAWDIEGPERVRRRFPADEAGLPVRFVEDLNQARTLKVRLLNGAHTAMVPPGLLMGLQSVGESMSDPTLRKFVEELLYQEVIPTLPHPMSEAVTYARSVLERFQNPFIRHRLADIALNSSAKFATRLQPSQEEAFRQAGRLPPRLTIALAALIRMYRGDHFEPRDSEAAIRHFRDAWQANTPEAVAQQALTWWNLSPPLQTALTPAIGKLLAKMEHRTMAELLLKVNNALD